MDSIKLKDEQILIEIIRNITNKEIFNISYDEVINQRNMIETDNEKIFLTTNYLIRLDYNVYEYQYAIFYKNKPLGIKYLEFMNIDLIKEEEKIKEEEFNNKIREFVKI